MTQLGEARHRLDRDAILKGEHTAACAVFETPARAIQRFLRIQPVVEHGADEVGERSCEGDGSGGGDDPRRITELPKPDADDRVVRAG